MRKSIAPAAAILIIALALAAARARHLSDHPAQVSQADQADTAGNGSPPSQAKPEMSGMNHQAHAGSDAERSPEAEQGAMESMSHGHLHMDAHMRMTELRPPAAGDAKKAAEIAGTLRASVEKYRDYHAAIQAGYRPFLPNVKMPTYHFTNYWYGLLGAFSFDPARATSLLYRKTPGGYELIGAMYTAPKRFSEDQLNQRVPLSVARWHQHVNICLPPRDHTSGADWTKFGPLGSIATEDACRAADGRWFPVIFGWMVHVYPFESDPAKVWAH